MSNPPASTRFLPVREAVLDEWLENFAGLISAAPAKYGLTAGDAAVIAAAVAGWHAAFLAGTSAATRTIGTVAAKRGQKRAVTAVARRYAARIRSDDGIGNDLKIGLGLIIRNAAGSPVPVPESRPVLSLRAMDQGVQHLRASDTLSPTRRGKPVGAAALVVFRTVADGAAIRPEDDGSGNGAAYLGMFTRPSFTSTFDRAHRGKTATYFARWVNTKGQPGPWSQGMSVAIAA